MSEEQGILQPKADDFDPVYQQLDQQEQETEQLAQGGSSEDGGGGGGTSSQTPDGAPFSAPGSSPTSSSSSESPPAPPSDLPDGFSSGTIPWVIVDQDSGGLPGGVLQALPIVVSSIGELRHAVESAGAAPWLLVPIDLLKRALESTPDGA